MLIIRLGCIGILLSLFVWPMPAQSWDNHRHQPQFQQEDEDDKDSDNKDSDDESTEVTSQDAGTKKEQAPLAAPRTPQIDDAGSPPELAPNLPKKVAPTPRIIPAKTPAPRPVVKIAPDNRKENKSTVAAPLVAPMPTISGVPPRKSPSPVIEGRLSLDRTYPQAALIWELRILWAILGLMALALLSLLFHFLLPFQGVRFLGKFAHKLLLINVVALGGVLGYQYIFLQIPPTSTHQSGLLWFGWIGLVSYLWQRRSYSQVHINAGLLLLIVSAALAWSLVGHIHIPGLPVASHQLSLPWMLGQFSMYTAFGILATSGSWMISSVFLGMLARREKGTGYGLQPEQWEEYRLHPSFLVFLAYPWLTISMVAFLFSSQFLWADPMKIWTHTPRLFSVLVVWLLLTAHLFALRSPQKNQEQEDTDELMFAVSQKPARLPGFLLFLATVGGSVLFVGVHILLSYLRNL